MPEKPIQIEQQLEKLRQHKLLEQQYNRELERLEQQHNQELETLELERKQKLETLGKRKYPKLYLQQSIKELERNIAFRTEQLERSKIELTKLRKELTKLA